MRTRSLDVCHVRDSKGGTGRLYIERKLVDCKESEHGIR
jgi:hypothetical protein